MPSFVISFTKTLAPNLAVFLALPMGFAKFPCATPLKTEISIQTNFLWTANTTEVDDYFGKLVIWLRDELYNGITVEYRWQVSAVSSLKNFQLGRQVPSFSAWTQRPPTQKTKVYPPKKSCDGFRVKLVLAKNWPCFWSSSKPLHFRNMFFKTCNLLFKTTVRVYMK